MHLKRLSERVLVFSVVGASIEYSLDSIRLYSVSFVSKSQTLSHS